MLIHRFITRGNYLLLRVKTLHKIKDSLAVSSTNKHSFTTLTCNVRKFTVKDFRCVTYSTQDNKSDGDNKLSSVQKLKKAVADYGSTVIVFHIAISLVSLGLSYVLVSNGLDAGEVCRMLGFKEDGKTFTTVTNAGTFAIAYALHKVFAPIRITITLTSVPFIVRILRNKGILKKP